MSELKWIPIEDRLPPNNQKVLVLNLDGVDINETFKDKFNLRILEGFFTPQKGWEMEEGCARNIHTDVRYWMALPEMPEE